MRQLTNMLLLFLCVQLIVCGCSDKKDLDFNFSMNNSDAYVLERDFLADLELKEPKGLLFLLDTLWISDSGNDRLVLYDFTNDSFRIIGETGSKNKQFINPGDISVGSDNKIYIVDSGNKRIQILDVKGNYIDEIDIKKILKNEFSKITGIGFDQYNDNKYISTYTVDKKDAHVYMINEKGESKKIGDNLCGYIYSSHDNIFFVNHLDLRNSPNNTGYSGEHFLFKIEGNRVFSKKVLPNFYAPKSIVCNNDYIYLLSSFLTIDRFTLEGEYIDTIYHGDHLADKGLSDIAVDNEKNIYVSDNINNKIYKLEKVK